MIKDEANTAENTESNPATLAHKEMLILVFDRNQGINRPVTITYGDLIKTAKSKRRKMRAENSLAGKMNRGLAFYAKVFQEGKYPKSSREDFNADEAFLGLRGYLFKIKKLKEQYPEDPCYLSEKGKESYLYLCKKFADLPHFSKKDVDDFKYRIMRLTDV